MGLGKTYVASEKMKQLGLYTNLVVCQKSKVDDWIEHFKLYYPNFEVFDLTKKPELDCFLEAERHPQNFNIRVGVINYDLIFRRNGLKDLTGYTLILDESSEIQNERAKRSRFILKLKPSNVILLSGTPTAGKYERLWSQLHLLGWSISKNLYYQQYINFDWVEMNGFYIQRVNGYKNVDRLKTKLREHGAIFMKSEEVFDLPDQTFIRVETKPPKEYRKFMRDRIVTINGHEFIGDTLLSERIYARMICSYLNKERVTAFRDLVLSTDDRLIVFYNYTGELNTMLSAIADCEKPISIVNGNTKDLTAYENCDNSITFVQYQAGSMGLNLQKANKVIYFSLTDRSELFEQSKKRIHRIGQTQKCFYYIMICPNTIEESILYTLELRKDYTDDLFKEYKKTIK